MIVKETYISPTALYPLIKVYSDKGFFIQKGPLVCQEAIVANEAEANQYIETNRAVPAPIADQTFVYTAFIGEYQNLTQEEILNAKSILIKALKTLSDEEAYQVKFLYNEWQPTAPYSVGDRVKYQNELYNVIKVPLNTVPPDENSDCFKITNRPANLIEEWKNTTNHPYSVGEKIRIGEHIYESLINENMWSPVEFASGWKLVK